MSDLKIFFDDSNESSGTWPARIWHPQITQRKVTSLGDRFGVHVPKGHGENLRFYLATYGIVASVHRIEGATFDLVEIDGDNFPDDVQEAVDHWTGSASLYSNSRGEGQGGS